MLQKKLSFISALNLFFLNNVLKIIDFSINVILEYRNGKIYAKNDKARSREGIWN